MPIIPNSSPFSTLPPELISRIFEHLHSSCSLVVNWYQITHVCRQWRYLAIDTPWLWTPIPTDPDYDNPEWTRVVLERSKSHPVDVHLIATPWKMNLAVFRHISHISDLHLEFLGLKALGDMVYYLAVIGDEPKVLEVLNIGGNNEEYFDLPSTCFRGADMLRSLSLQWVNLNWRTTPFLSENLTNLSLECMSDDAAPSWADLFAALGRMHALTDLTLRHIFSMVPASDQSSLTGVSLPCLQDLSIAAEFAFQIRLFLLYVSFPPLQRVEIGCDSHDPGQQDYSTALQPIAQSFPPSSYGQFNEFSIALQQESYIDRFRLRFVCSTSPNYTASGGCIELLLAPTFNVPTEDLISNILVDLNLRHSLTSLYISHPDDEFFPSASYLRLFGALPSLAHITVSGQHSLYLVEALHVPLGHPFGTPLPFPVLRRLDFVGIDTEQDAHRCDDLEDVLMARYEYGAEIQTLCLEGCLCISKAAIKRFADIVVDFHWYVDEMEEICMEMCTESDSEE